jgi:hypothetical protein
MKAKNIIWGLVLVMIGVLFILRNLDIIYFSWHSIWRLWPLILVLVGVMIIPVKDSIKIALSIVVIIIAALFMVYYPSHDRPDQNWSFNWDDAREADEELTDIDQRIFEAYDTTINEAYLVFDAAAGDFRINQETGELFEFERDGNLGRYNYSMKELGPKREINIELEEGRVIRGDLKNRVAIKLNPKPVWELKVDVGAANIDMDLTLFKVSKLNVDGGASSINIRLGNLQNDCRLKLNSGASSINIQVPEEFACEINTSTVLSSKDLPGFNKLSSGTYVTPDFSDKSGNIVIDIDAAVSSLTIIRY